MTVKIQRIFEQLSLEQHGSVVKEPISRDGLPGPWIVYSVVMTVWSILLYALWMMTYQLYSF